MLLLRPLPALGALLLALLVLLGGASPARASAPALTPVQERVVLELIDAACGDTWCEGDHAFSFQRLACSAQEAVCRLRLRIAPYDDAPLRWRWRTGELGYRTYEQMVVTSTTGSRALDPGFFLALTDLVHRLEATVPVATPAA